MDSTRFSLDNEIVISSDEEATPSVHKNIHSKKSLFQSNLQTSVYGSDEDQYGNRSLSASSRKFSNEFSAAKENIEPLPVRFSKQSNTSIGKNKYDASDNSGLIGKEYEQHVLKVSDFNQELQRTEAPISQHESLSEKNSFRQTSMKDFACRNEERQSGESPLSNASSEFSDAVSPKNIEPLSVWLSKPKDTNSEQCGDHSLQFSNKVTVSAREYEEQKIKVLNLKQELQRLENTKKRININNLPDKGKQLFETRDALLLKVEQEDLKLSNLVARPVNTTGHNELPPISWSDLEAASTAVQPKTFGRKGLATLNMQKALTMDRLEQLYESLQNCPGEDQLAIDPKGLNLELMLHQKRALLWLIWREKEKPSGGILADDMGLGKTLTMISLLLKTKELDEDEDSDDENNPSRSDYKYKGGTLVVCPATLLQQWEHEVNKHVRRGKIIVELYHGPRREVKPRRLARHDMVITTYSIVMNEGEKQGPLCAIRWRRIILDEAHQIRNHKNQTSVAVCNLSARSRWALTGTPIHNQELDLYGLLKFLRCSPFDELAVWKRWVADKTTGGQQRLNTVISSLMLRRTKQQLQEQNVLKSLPERTWELIKIKLDPSETSLYQKILIFSKTLFAQFLHQRASKEIGHGFNLNFKMQDDPNGEYTKMRNALMKMNKVRDVHQHEILVLLLRLRQICCHPHLIIGMLQNEDIDEDELVEDASELNILEQLNKLNLDDNDYEPSAVDQDSVKMSEASKTILKSSNPIFAKDRRSSKIKAILKILQEQIIPKGEKAIVVSQWKSLLDLISTNLKAENISHEQLDGSVPVIKRMAIVDNFNNSKHHARILLLSLTAGGVGLNLVGGNHLLLVDLHWNPQLEIQAQDRIYRVGQKRHVFVYKLMVEDTIEERIKALQDHKMTIANDILTGAKSNENKLSLNDLKMLFNM